MSILMNQLGLKPVELFSNGKSIGSFSISDKTYGKLFFDTMKNFPTTTVVGEIIPFGKENDER